MGDVSPSNLAWLQRHVGILRASYLHWTGQPLIDPSIAIETAPQYLAQLPYPLVSHDTQSDPVFNYANPAALQLFEMSWQDFTALPSRLSAEPIAQQERKQLLQQVSQHGYIDDYGGIRISSTGKRFHIRNATVWNLCDATGQPYGQAALLRQWQPLSG